MYPEVSSIDAPETTIDSLPAELLIRICHFNAYRFYEPVNRLTKTLPPIPSHLQDTINASQVCRRWRVMLIASPGLWRHMIDIHHPRKEWTDLLLERSQPLGISLLTTRYSWDKPFHEPDMGPQERIAEYRFWSKYDRIYPLAAREDSFLKVRKNMSQLHLPLLESLFIHFPFFPSDLETSNHDCTKCRLPKGFPGASTPALKHLYLHDTLPELSQFSFLSHTLVTLSIFDIEEHLQPTLGEWLDVVTHLPRLRTFSLDHATRVSPAARGQLFTPVKDRVVLPFEDFRIRDEGWICAHILRHVTFTNSLRVFAITARNTQNDAISEYLLHTLPKILSFILTSESSHRIRNALEVQNFGLTYLGFLERDLPEGNPSPIFAKENTCFHWMFSVQFDAALIRRPGWPLATDVHFNVFLHTLFNILPPNLWNEIDTAAIHFLDNPGYYWDADLLYENVLLKLHNLRRLVDIDLPLWDMVSGHPLQTQDPEGVTIDYLPALEELAFNVGPSDNIAIFSRPTFAWQLDLSASNSSSNTRAPDGEYDALSTSYLMREDDGGDSSESDSSDGDYIPSERSSIITLDTHTLYDEIVEFCELRPKMRVIRYPPCDVGNTGGQEKTVEDLVMRLDSLGIRVVPCEVEEVL